MTVFDTTLFLSTLITLLVILDPPGIGSIFLALTGSLTRAQRHAAALRAALVAILVISVFAVFGQRILDYLHISLAALQGAGGLLLLLVALQLLTGKESEVVADSGANVALVPLGTPLLAGPGAIVATMLSVQKADSFGSYVAVAVGVVGALTVVYVFMRFASAISGFLRESGTMLLTRIAGLLLSAIAVQMIANAVRAFVTEGA